VQVTDSSCRNGYEPEVWKFEGAPSFLTLLKHLASPSAFVIALLGGLPHHAALAHEAVPVHFPTLVDTHDSPHLGSWLATTLRSAAELAPFLHLADELLLTPRLLASLGALAAQETCGFVEMCHAWRYNLTLG
jgi:hypothetical protein